MRTELCLKAYNNYKKIDKGEIATTYFNKFFNKNMDLLVCDFYWACSRKSYLPCGQVCDIYSYDAIKNALLAGARLINLDIYPDNKGIEPIVRDYRPMPEFMSGLKTFLDLELCLKIIKKYAWIDAPNYPLILYLNIHTDSKVVLYNLAKILYKVLNGHFLNKKYSFNGRNGLYKFSQIPINELFGNVGIITDKYPTIEILDELINGITNNGNIITTDYYPSTQAFGGIISTFGSATDIINNNKLNLMIVDSVTNVNKELTHSVECIAVQNFRNPKSDIYNADPEDCWKYGCQLLLMNYQLYDDNMKKYIEKFSQNKAGLVLKPDELRYIAQPKPAIAPQSIKASYKPRTIGVEGWYSYKV